MWNLLIQILFITLLALTACTKKGDFSTEACTRGNSNCDLPSMQVDVVGSDSSTQANVGNNEGAGTIEVKTIRFGEKAYIEFVLKNPKLTPLQNMTFSMNPGDASFTIVTSMNNQDCGSQDLLLLFGQDCSITVEYKPGLIPPVLQELIFNFKTLLGDDFVFSANFDPAKLLPDFYVADEYLVVPSTVLYAAGSATGTEWEIPVINTGTETDLSNIQFILNGSSEWTLTTPPSNACIQGQILAKRGGTCNLKLHFTPLTPGTKTISLVLVSGGNSTREYLISAEALGITPDLETLDFGAALLGSASSTKTLTLSFPNGADGAASANCTYVLTGDPSFQIATNTCLSSQPATSTCQATIQWQPSASAITEHIGQFQWSCDNRGGSDSIPIRAQSVNSPLISDQTVISFGDHLVGSATTRTIQFNNLGSLGSLDSFVRTLTGSGFNLSTTTCTDIFAAGASCTYAVVMTPLAAGKQNGTLMATTTQTTMDYDIELSGDGLAVTASASVIDFGVVGIGNDRPGSSLLITNPSTTESATDCALTYSQLTEQNFSLDSGSINSCSIVTTLAPGESCTIEPRFTSALPEGDRAVTLTYACSVGGSTQVTLSAYAAIETRLVVAPPSHMAINNHLVGTSNDIEFLLMNEHEDQVANNISITTPDIAGGWLPVAASVDECVNGSNLAPGETCRVRLRFSPSAAAGTEQAGSFTGTLAVSADNGIINPPDGLYSSVAKKIEPDESTFEVGTTNVGNILVSSAIGITNPSSLDAASGCTLSISSGFEILATTCGATGIAPEASCYTRVKFLAVASPQAATGTLDYTCSVGGRARVALNVDVEPIPNFIWSGNADFGYLDTDAPAVERTYTLTNNETYNIQLSSVALTGGDNSFTLVSKTCNIGTVLAANGGSCTMTLSLDTSDEVIHYANIEAYGFHQGTAATPQLSSVNLSGTGSHMTFTASANAFIFADQQAGNVTTEDKTLTLTNSGTRPAYLSYAALSSPFSNAATGTCGATLNASSSCTVILRMGAGAGTGLPDEQTFVITETNHGLASNTSVALTGTTFATGVLSIKDNRTDTYTTTALTTDITGTLGNTNNIVDLLPATRGVTFTFANGVSGASSFTLTTAVLNHVSGTNNRMAISQNNCNGITLANLGTCTITVTYTPSVVQEASVYSLVLTGTDLLGNTVSASASSITGTSLKSATLTMAPSSHDFGSRLVSTTIDQEFSLQNSGDFAATLTSIAITGTNNSMFTKQDGTSAPNCGATLSAGTTCYFNVRFAPTAAATFTNTLTTTYDLTKTVSATLTANAYQPPELKIQDNLDNTSATTGAITTDITGPLGHSRNIVNDSPSSKTVTYTITNSASGGGGGAIVLGNASFTYVSGTAGKMTANSSNCDGQTLAELATCTITVTYDPTDPDYHDSTVYSLAISGTTVLSTTLTMTVTTISGNAFKAATLALSTSTLDFGILASGATGDIELTVTNSGDFTANPMTMSFSGTNAASFTEAAGTSGTDCGDSLAAGATCYFKVHFAPTGATAFSNTITVTYDTTKTVTGSITAASYHETVGFGGNGTGYEPEIAADSNYIYISSYQTNVSTYSNPVVTICDRESTNWAVTTNTANCTQNILKGGSNNLLASFVVGSGPKIAVGTNMIVLAVNNKDSATYGGDAANGNATLIICKKPGGSRTIAFATDCQVQVIHDANSLPSSLAGSGNYPSLVLRNNKVALSSQIIQAAGYKGFILTVCDFDDTAVTAASALSTATCAYHVEDLTDQEKSETSHLAFNGSQISIAAYNKTAGALYAMICDVHSSTNAITCGIGAGSGYKQVANAAEADDPTTTNDDGDGGVAPGTYPSIIMDNGHFYIAHQQGQNPFRHIRLADCTTSGRDFSCLHKTIVSAGDVGNTGKGFIAPRISVSGSGSGARIWTSYLRIDSDTSMIAANYSEVKYCTIQASSAPVCESTAYQTRSTSVTSSQLVSRGHFLDTVNNLLLIPQTYSGNIKLGVWSLGLTPEL
jgi:hypothetical protein